MRDLEALDDPPGAVVALVQVFVQLRAKVGREHCNVVRGG